MKTLYESILDTDITTTNKKVVIAALSDHFLGTYKFEEKGSTLVMKSDNPLILTDWDKDWKGNAPLAGVIKFFKALETENKVHMFTPPVGPFFKKLILSRGGDIMIKKGVGNIEIENPEQKLTILYETGMKPIKVHSDKLVVMIGDSIQELEGKLKGNIKYLYYKGSNRDYDIPNPMAYANGAGEGIFPANDYDRYLKMKWEEISIKDLFKGLKFEDLTIRIGRNNNFSYNLEISKTLPNISEPNCLVTKDNYYVCLNMYNGRNNFNAQPANGSWAYVKDPMK